MAEALDRQIPLSDGGLPQSGVPVIRIDDEAVLVDKGRKGDPAALETLILRYQNRIYNVILKICANRDDAAELSQQTFVKIIENIKDFEQRSGFYTWAFRIAVNLALSYRKRKGRIVFGSLDSSSDEGGSPQTRKSAFGGSGGDAKKLLRVIIRNDVAPDPAVLAQNKELCELVTRQLEKLTDEHRVVLILRDIEGMDYAQIAQVTGAELGTVKSRLSRARDALRRFLETVV